MKTIAIGNEGRVELWCRVNRRLPSGRIDFFVINGDWSGSLHAGMITVNATKSSHPGQLLWEGTVPIDHYDYNSAIAWIQKHIDAR